MNTAEIMPKLFTFNFMAMGCQGEMQLYADDEKIAQSLVDLALADIKFIEEKYSRYKTDSIISRINFAAGKNSVEVDEETASLIEFAATCFEQSNGLFDITSGVLRRVWDFKTNKIPSQNSINEVLPMIGWQKVEWSKPMIRLPIVGMEIDFGGIGKEYAVDRVCGLLQKNGLELGLVNLGGDVRVIGSQPSGKPWSIGVNNPRNPGKAITSLSLSSGAIATSGDYERFIIVDGIRYCHILNPKTGWPVNDFQSISAISDSCLVAGTATTIAMLLGDNEGISFLKDLGLSFFAIKANGEKITNK